MFRLVTGMALAGMLVPAPGAASCLEWDRQTAGPLAGACDSGAAIGYDAAGNVYLGGSTATAAPCTGSAGLLQSLTPGGALRWSRTVAWTVNAVAAAPAGAVYAAGVLGGDWLITRMDPASGSDTGVVSYAGPAGGTDVPSRAAVDPAGNLIVAGLEFVSGEGNNLLVRTYSSNLGLLWSRSYNGPGNGDDAATALAVAPGGAVYAGGRSDGANWLVRAYASDGTPAWSRLLPGGQVAGLAVGAAGEIFAAGSLGSEPWHLRCYSAAGADLRARSFTFGWGGALRDLAADAAGGVYAVGTGEGGLQVIGFTPSLLDFWRYAPGAVMSGNAIAASTGGRLAITGQGYTVAGGVTDNNVQTIQFLSHDECPGIPRLEMEFVVYPNPVAGDVVHLSLPAVYSTALGTAVHVEIMNDGRQMVYEGRWPELSSGIGGVNVKGITRWPEGVYWCHVTVGVSDIGVRKIVVKRN